MSTKIYNGMVIPLNKLGIFTGLFYDKAIEKARKNIKELSKKMEAGKSKKILKKQYDLDCPSEDAIPTLIMCWLINSSKTGMVYGNYDMWFNAWIIGKKVYLYAPCDNSSPFPKDFPSWCKNFSYWNNTDPDPKASNKEWNIRCKMWNKIMDYGNIQSKRLTFMVIEGKEVMHHGILDLFPNIEKDKLYSLHSMAFFAKEIKDNNVKKE